MASLTTMSYAEDVWSNATNTTVSPYQEILDLHFGGVYVHPHYYQYLDYIISLPDIYFYLMGIYIAIVGLVGTLGNLLVIYIFCTTRALRSPPNIFIINLAISDMGFSAINGFPLMTISAFSRYWYFGKTGCTIYALIGGLTGFNSIATLACISLDRFYVIAYPFDAMRKCTKKRALIQVMFVWIWSIALSFPPVFGFGSYIAEGVQVECSFDYVSQDWLSYSYNYIILVVGFFLPVFIIIICYILIIRAVSSQAAQMRAKAEKMGSDGAKTQKERQQNIQLAKIAAITISLFILSWMPYAIFATAGNNGYMKWVTPTTTQVPVLFAKASAIWNPILYALSHPKFRGVLEERFPYLLMCKGSNIDKGDDKSQVTETTRGNLGRDDSIMSETSDVGNQEMGKTGGNVSRAPGGRQRRQETQFSGEEGGHAALKGVPSSDVNPRAMTRAANTIFSHLVTAYEGMRVLTTSGDGTGANKLEGAFSNPAFEGDRAHTGQQMPPAGYYGYGGPHPQQGFMPMQAGPGQASPNPNSVYAVPVPTPGMVPYPGYFPAQPAMGQGQMPGQMPGQMTGQQPHAAEAHQQALPHQQPRLSPHQVQLHPHQMQMHPHKVQVHQTIPPSHQPQNPQNNNAAPKANQVTTEAIVNSHPTPEADQKTPQNDNTNVSYITPPKTLTTPPQQPQNTENEDQNVNNSSSAMANQELHEEEVGATTEVEDLPPPPEEFLDELEEDEDSGQYNFGRSDTIKMTMEEAGNETSAISSASADNVAPDSENSTGEARTDGYDDKDDECRDENMEDNHKATEELRAIEEIDKAIDDTKLSHDASPEAADASGNDFELNAGDAETAAAAAAAENDGETEEKKDIIQGDNVDTEEDDISKREGGNKTLAKQYSIKYEDGFV